MLGLSPSSYVLRAVSNVHTNDLEQTLLVSGSGYNHILDLFGGSLMLKLLKMENSIVVYSLLSIISLGQDM